jgi:elongation factor 1-alpha
MSQQLRAEFVILNIKQGLKGKTMQAVVRKHQRDGFKPEVRICLLGDFASGKSTLLGVLTSGKLDNGNGLARLSVLNHKHEVLSGITSSQTYAMLGFDAFGNVTNDNGFGTSFERIFDSSTKIMSFFDQGGHEKYSKSTVQSVMTNCPDYGMIVINPLKGITRNVIENFRIVTAL